MACHLACRSIVLIDIYRVKELTPLDKPKEEALVYAYATAEGRKLVWILTVLSDEY